MHPSRDVSDITDVTAEMRAASLGSDMCAPVKWGWMLVKVPNALSSRACARLLLLQIAAV